MQRQVMWMLLIAMVLVPALSGAVTEADFEAKTTQNLLNLCTASPMIRATTRPFIFVMATSWAPTTTT